MDDHSVEHSVEFWKRMEKRRIAIAAKLNKLHDAGVISDSKFITNHMRLYVCDEHVYETIELDLAQYKI